jgi:hypothetical protein
MAMACLRLVTLLPLRPLRSVPFLRFRIARSTSFDAPFEYFRAILLLLKQIPVTAVANAVDPMLVTTVCETLFRGLTVRTPPGLRS